MLTADISAQYNSKDANKCTIKPCSQLGETIGLIFIIIFMAIFAALMLFLQGKYFYKIPVGVSRRGLYWTMVFFGLLSGGMGIMLLFLYKKYNAWVVVGQVAITRGSLLGR